MCIFVYVCVRACMRTAYLQLIDHCVTGGKYVRGLLFLNSWHTLTENGDSAAPIKYSVDAMSRLAWSMELVCVYACARCAAHLSDVLYECLIFHRCKPHY